MQTKGAEYYREKIQQVHKEISHTFKLLRKRKGTQPQKERARIKKGIKKLYEQLQDLKYRATY